ncbi:MAG: hypothetical protein JWN04_3306 [Myxococcaceae bacterium]|nr:hypothetical protein [Myxococcaceae bacterium]
MLTPRSSTPLKLSAALVPALAFLVFLAFRPIDQFGFRAWDSLTAMRSGPIVAGRFYPLQRTRRDEVGDLAPYTRDAVIKRSVLWETDAWGFRNEARRYECPTTTAIVGDSMAAGGSLSQESDLSSMLERSLATCTLNLGGVPLETALAFLDLRKIKPSVLVLVLAESAVRSPGGFDAQGYARALRQVKYQLAAPPWLTSLMARATDQLLDAPFHAFKARHGIVEAVRRAFSDRDSAVLTAGKESPTGRMVFLSETLPAAPTPSMELPPQQAAEVIATIASETAARGAKLYIVPVPEKEAVYGAPAERTESEAFLNKFCVEAEKLGVWCAQLFDEYRSDYRDQHILNHHLDDTHWNEHGVSRAAAQVSNRIRRELPDLRKTDLTNLTQ